MLRSLGLTIVFAVRVWFLKWRNPSLLHSRGRQLGVCKGSYGSFREDGVSREWTYGWPAPRCAEPQGRSFLCASRGGTRCVAELRVSKQLSSSPTSRQISTGFSEPSLQGSVAVPEPRSSSRRLRSVAAATAKDRKRQGRSLKMETELGAPQHGPKYICRWTRARPAHRTCLDAVIMAHSNLSL